jgi:uncharacterized membrane protein YgcG
VRRKHVLTPEELARLAARADDRPPTWLMTGFFGVFIGIGFYMVGLGLRSKTSFPILFGGFFGGLPFLLSLVPVFNASIRVLGPLAVVAVVLGLVTGRSSPSTAAPQTGVSGSFRRDRRLRRTGLEGASGYSGSSDDDSSSRSSSSSSGTDSSSFGGGQSSGGGASGSW